MIKKKNYGPGIIIGGLSMIGVVALATPLTWQTFLALVIACLIGFIIGSEPIESEFYVLYNHSRMFK